MNILESVFCSGEGYCNTKILLEDINKVELDLGYAILSD